MTLHALYAAAATIVAPGLRLMLTRRARTGKEIAARLPERRGIDPTPRPPGRLLWLHAASVGESVSVLPVLSAFAAAMPEATVLLTTGTVTSAATLAHRLPRLGLSESVLHRFAPLDVPAWAARFLDHWRPDAAAFVESEIWPNLFSGCARRGIPMALINARMSGRSFSRWRLLPRLARRLFGGLAWVQAQSADDAARLQELGAPASVLTGNLKFAADPLPVDAGEFARLRGLLAGRPVWLAASIHPGEDAPVLDVHARLAREFPDLLTIIVPRHPERGAEIATICDGVAVTRRAAGQDPPAAAGVWVADTLGELGLFYGLTGFAFVGRSLGAAGGQNPLEPARLGCAVAVGPEVQNFSDIVATLAAAGGLEQVADADGLARWVGAMIRDPARRAAIGQAGRAAASAEVALPRLVARMLADLVCAP